MAVALQREGSSSGRRGGGGTFGSSPTPGRTTAAVNADDELVARMQQAAAAGRTGAVTEREKVRMVTLAAIERRGYRSNEVFRDALTQRKRRTSIDEASVEDAALRWYAWTDEERQAWADYLVSVGALDPEDARDMGKVQQLWEAAVDEAANYRAAGRTRVTPWDAVRIASEFGGGPGSKKGGFTGTKTQRSRSTDITDPNTARAMVHDVLTRQFGREATDAEVRAFTETLNAAEMANPATTTTTQQYSDGELVNVDSVTAGGLTQAGRQQVLDEKAMAAPEYGAYQAAAFYAPLLMQAIGAPV